MSNPKVQTVPTENKKLPGSKAKNKPWWDSECENAKKERKQAEKDYNVRMTSENFMIYKKKAAEARRLFEKKKRQLNDSQVVYGHQIFQTHDIKWLCLDEIYNKFYRPNLYDIGGTHTLDVPDYWFTYKTEQVGDIFLLHLFVCNHDINSFSIVVSCSNELKIDRKKNIVYMQKLSKEFQFKELSKLSHNYLTTYTFSSLDIECLRGKKLYIAVSFPPGNNEGISLDVINDIKLNHDCSALLADPIGSDFTIESADGAKFQVHKVILAAHSEVFKAMLKEETAESQNSYVKLVDVSEEDLLCMLEFIYTGSVLDIDNVNSANLLMLGDRYNLRGLSELSQYALLAKMKSDNVLDILVLADMYDSDFLKLEAMKYIKRNKEVLKNSTFKEINNASLIRELCTFLAS